MSIDERIERIKELRQGIEQNLSLFTILPSSESERINSELNNINQQIVQDQERLLRPELKVMQAYCPPVRRMRERDYCENMNGSGRVCASLDRCYD